MGFSNVYVVVSAMNALQEYGSGSDSDNENGDDENGPTSQADVLHLQEPSTSSVAGSLVPAINATPAVTIRVCFGIDLC